MQVVLENKLMNYRSARVQWDSAGFKSGLVAIAFFLLVSPVSAFDFSGWDQLLKKHVSTTTLAGVRLNAVDYKGMKVDPKFGKIINALKNFSPDSLNGHKEKLAFWINTYNVFAVKMVVDHYPVQSIKDVGSLFTSVWKRPVGFVGGKERSLDEIEHKILRKMGEPRIHLAIVCASVSCPDLRKEAYTSNNLDAQLDDQASLFLANPGKGLRVEGRNVYLSHIFDWFEEDFESQGGVLSFVKHYAPSKDQAALQGSDVKVKYIDYDWDLNEIKS